MAKLAEGGWKIRIEANKSYIFIKGQNIFDFCRLTLALPHKNVFSPAACI